MQIFINFDEDLEPVPDEKTDEQQKPKFNENLYRSVEELELSVRSANCLKNAEILKIYQLVQKSEAEMLKTKNFGRKSLNEIKEVLTEMGLSLGMKLEGFVPPEEDEEDPAPVHLTPGPGQAHVLGHGGEAGGGGRARGQAWTPRRVHRPSGRHPRRSLPGAPGSCSSCSPPSRR